MKWLPPNGALHGFALDRLLHWNLDIIFWLFVLSQVLMVAALILRRFVRPAPAKARSLRMRFLTEFLPLAAVVGLYAWMVTSSHHLWVLRRERAASANVIHVEVTGVQFHWYFRYPGPDGVYGKLRPALVNAPMGNPLGLDAQDPHGQDDVVSSVLMLPAGQPVELRLRSQDVIHGFFVPGMRLKQDTIPGMIGHLRFTPDVPGVYPILCSQVCGLGHARMQARMRVVSDAEFRQWLAQREKALQADASPVSTAGGRS